jgi:uncharacterized protein YjbJ (UPF0337 family)
MNRKRPRQPRNVEPRVETTARPEVVVAEDLSSTLCSGVAADFEFAPRARVELRTGTPIAHRHVEADMNQDVIKGKWHQLKGEVKTQWSKLTDDDLTGIEGDAEKLVGRVQERYGYARDQAKREVDAFFDRHSR